MGSYSAELVTVLLAGKTPSKADLALKAEQAAHYVRTLWITLASVVAFLTVCHIVRSLASIRRTRKDWSNALTLETGEKEAVNSHQSKGKVSLRRVPLALATCFRIVAFRTTLWIGPGAVLSISEFAFISIYVGIMLMFVLIDSEWPSLNSAAFCVHSGIARNLTITFWEDRAAHIASCQVPLIVALAGKNNIISCLWSLFADVPCF